MQHRKKKIRKIKIMCKKPKEYSIFSKNWHFGGGVSERWIDKHNNYYYYSDITYFQDSVCANRKNCRVLLVCSSTKVPQLVKLEVCLT